MNSHQVQIYLNLSAQLCSICKVFEIWMNFAKTIEMIQFDGENFHSLSLCGNSNMVKYKHTHTHSMYCLHFRSCHLCSVYRICLNTVYFALVFRTAILIIICRNLTHSNSMWREQLNGNTHTHMMLMLCLCSSIILNNHHFCIKHVPWHHYTHTIHLTSRIKENDYDYDADDDNVAAKRRQGLANAHHFKFNSCCNFSGIFFNALNYFLWKGKFIWSN